MLPQIAGVALAAVVYKLRASRPHYKRHRGAYSVPESAAPGAGAGASSCAPAAHA
jgi:hypothetical protein